MLHFHRVYVRLPYSLDTRKHCRRELASGVIYISLLLMPAGDRDKSSNSSHGNPSSNSSSLSLLTSESAHPQDQSIHSCWDCFSHHTLPCQAIGCRSQHMQFSLAAGIALVTTPCHAKLGAVHTTHPRNTCRSRRYERHGGHLWLCCDRPRTAGGADAGHVTSVHRPLW